MQKTILTVGDLRRAMQGLHENCTVELLLDYGHTTTSFGDGLSVEPDDYDGIGFLTIIADLTDLT